ncbi:MAG: hypothetical protein DCC67_17510 [Planctomycetota bacterium]|nr:MAG: hypothetical protein DCC67_17510 [Planctomycetota bacterium]
MSESAAPALPATLPPSAHSQQRAPFVAWVLAQLGIPVHAGDRELLIDLAEPDRPAFDGQAQLRVALGPDVSPPQESLALDGRFGRWLAARLQSSGAALHARPRMQPMAVNEISARLFPAYEVENGQIHLAGCQLTDHPFLRLSFAADEGDWSVRHVYVSPDGAPLADELVARLGLDDLEPIRRHAPRLDDAALRSLVAAGRRIAAKPSADDDPGPAIVEPLVAAVIWVRHAQGTLQFTIGRRIAHLPFSAWASLLTPPPFIAPHSGASTYRLAATDDGRIDAADEIAVCEQSGQRVLRQELVQCSVTGKRVLGELTAVCPVSGRPALRSTFVACTVCRQRVSSGVMEGGACQACRSLSSCSKDDPRLVWIFTEHPGLDRWKNWELAETATSYIAQAAGLWKRLLIVVDKETLAIRRLATADRLSKTWIDAPDALANELLK